MSLFHVKSESYSGPSFTKFILKFEVLEITATL